MYPEPIHIGIASMYVYIKDPGPDGSTAHARTMTNGDLLPAVDSADYCVLALSTSREKSLGTPEGACIHGYLGQLPRAVRGLILPRC